MATSENEVSFQVPTHAGMTIQVTGKRPNTILTVEATFDGAQICEYTERLFRERIWCYRSEAEACLALGMYLGEEIAVEPGYWIRAFQYGKPPREQPYQRIVL